jgi:hypothetical protein
MLKKKINVFDIWHRIKKIIIDKNLFIADEGCWWQWLCGEMAGWRDFFSCLI